MPKFILSDTATPEDVAEAVRAFDAWATEHNRTMAARARPGFWAWLRERMRELAAFRADLARFAAEYESERERALPETLVDQLAERHKLACSRIVHGGGRSRRFPGLLEAFVAERERTPHADFYRAANKIADAYRTALLHKQPGPHPSRAEIRAALGKYIAARVPHLRPPKSR